VHRQLAEPWKKINRETNIFNKRPSEVYHYLKWNYLAKRIKQGLLRYKTRGIRLAKSISGLR
jgi:hypothetical protein